MQRIVFGSDHAGLYFRKELIKWAEQNGYETAEFGATGFEAYDYPLAADLAVREVLKNEALGVLICGSGIGMSIRANRHPGVRAALCFTPEMAEMSRKHNHANVLCLGERLTDLNRALDILRKFLNTFVDLDTRHVNRVNLLDKPF